jgi:hypothetical protein
VSVLLLSRSLYQRWIEFSTASGKYCDVPTHLSGPRCKDTDGTLIFPDEKDKQQDEEEEEFVARPPSKKQRLGDASRLVAKPSVLLLSSLMMLMNHTINRIIP